MRRRPRKTRYRCWRCRRIGVFSSMVDRIRFPKVPRWMLRVLGYGGQAECDNRQACDRRRARNAPKAPTRNPLPPGVADNYCEIVTVDP